MRILGLDRVERVVADDQIDQAVHQLMVDPGQSFGLNVTVMQRKGGNGGKGGNEGSGGQRRPGAKAS